MRRTQFEKLATRLVKKLQDTILERYLQDQKENYDPMTVVLVVKITRFPNKRYSRRISVVLGVSAQGNILNVLNPRTQDCLKNKFARIGFHEFPVIVFHQQFIAVCRFPLPDLTPEISQ